MVDKFQADTVYSGYKNGDLRAIDLRNLGVYWKYTLADGVCDIDTSVGSLLASTSKGKYYLFHLEDMNGRNLPLVASLSSNSHPESSSTVWRGSYSPHNPQNFMTTTNDGYLSYYKQYVIFSQKFYWCKKKMFLTFMITC